MFYPEVLVWRGFARSGVKVGFRESEREEGTKLAPPGQRLKSQVVV